MSPRKKTSRRSSGRPRGRKLAEPSCPACGVSWADHLGIAGTCRKLERARGALKVLATLATFSDGECLTPADTKKICKRALQETNPN